MNTWTKKLAIDILLHTGIRLGELSALTPADILPTMHIDVNKTYVAVNGQKILIPPKTKDSKRCIPIPEPLYCEIQKYISEYRIPENSRLFSFTKATLQNYVNTISKKEGLPAINIYTFRNAYIDALRLKGLPSSKASAWLGLKKGME